LYVKRHADKLNVDDLFLRVLKCFSCLSEGREKERKKERKNERKKELDCIGVCVFSEIFTSCYMYVFYVSVMVSRGSVNPPLPPSSVFGTILAFVR
jgi:hypothetical protein